MVEFFEWPRIMLVQAWRFFTMDLLPGRDEYLSLAIITLGTIVFVLIINFLYKILLGNTASSGSGITTKSGGK